MAYLGNKIRAFVRPVGTELFAWLGGEQGNSISRSAEAVETSDKSSEWAQFIAGKRGATIEVSVFADADNPAQMQALDALVVGSPVEFLIGEILDPALYAAQVKGDYGVGIVTAVNDTNDFGAVASRSISITESDELTLNHQDTWDEEE